MSRGAADTNSSDGSGRDSDKVIAFFVCPGAKEVPIPHALISYGDGCTRMQPCPRRDFCMWFASHDLGGEIEFSDVPEGAQLMGEFTTQPFACRRFRLIRETRNRRIG